MGFQETNRTEHFYNVHDMQLVLANGGKLDDLKLLTVMLAKHLTQENAENIAARLLDRYSCLSGVLSAKLNDLLGVDGMTTGIALDLLHINHLLSAISWSTISKQPIIDCYESLIDYCAGRFSSSKNEQFHGIFLNKRYEVIHHACLQVGTLDHVTVYPREILKIALEYSSSHIILAHNHPFGKAKPSKADISMTKQLCALAEGLGISIIDHIIFAENNNFSFLENGLMKKQPADLLNLLAPQKPRHWK